MLMGLNIFLKNAEDSIMTNMYNNFSIIIVDVLVFSAMLAVTSIAVSLVLRKKEA